jgi:hypothetical protein
MAEIFEQAVDIALEKKDPKKKLERRLKRERKRNASKEKPCPDEVETSEEKQDAGENNAESRYIPSEVRERIFAKAGYQCQYRGPDGTRCSARTGLEIDHERPFAIYRRHEEHHLRLLCGPHNRYQAERVYGAEFIRAKIDAKKGASPL